MSAALHVAVNPGEEKRAYAARYSLRMIMCEGQLVNTIMVMYRIGAHDQTWEVCSNMAAGSGLNEIEARLVYKNALEIAKRRMRA